MIYLFRKQMVVSFDNFAIRSTRSDSTTNHIDSMVSLHRLPIIVCHSWTKQWWSYVLDTTCVNNYRISIQSFNVGHISLCNSIDPSRQFRLTNIIYTKVRYESIMYLNSIYSFAPSTSTVYLAIFDSCRVWHRGTDIKITWFKFFDARLKPASRAVT